MHRLFVGLRPPPAIRAALGAVMTGVERARWQDDDQLHLTLRYIGEVERPVAEDVATMLSNIRFPAITVALDGVGQFGARGRINALWAGVTPHDELTRLHLKIDRALVRIGLPPEGRAYLPHITIARISGSAGPIDGFLARNASLSSPPFELRHFLLFESHLGHDGARYEAIARYPLGPP